jgi:hypothetical protein
MRLYQNLQSTYAEYLRWYSSTTVPEDQDALAQNCCCVINRFLEEFTSKKTASRWDWEADFVAERTLYSLMYRRWSATQPELTASSLSGEVEEADTPNDLSKEDLKHRRSLPSILRSRLALHEELRTALFDRRNYFNEIAYVGFEPYEEKLVEVKRKRQEQERQEQERQEQERQEQERQEQERQEQERQEQERQEQERQEQERQEREDKSKRTRKGRRRLGIVNV